MNKFLNFLLRFFGGILLNLSLTLFILSFFAGYSIDNLNVFENSLKNMADDELGVNQTQKQQIGEFCRINPNNEGCEGINNENERFTDFMNKFINYKAYVRDIRILSIILFFVGALLIYYSNLSLIVTLYKVSLSGFFTSIFSVVYLKFLPDILRGIFNGYLIRNMVKDIPSEMFNRLVNVIMEWLTIPLNRTLMISLALSVIFLILTIIFYTAKKKGLNKKNLEKESNGKKQGTDS